MTYKAFLPGRGRPWPTALLGLLSVAWLTVAVAQDADTAAPSADAVDLDPAETTEPPNIDTGQHGTSSGLTRSDMNEPDEGSGSGQSQGDDIFQTPAAASDAGPAYETQSPERESPYLPDDPEHAEETGRQEGDDEGNGEPQSSNEDSPE
ncbi:hypothetical protein ACOJCM_04415 [Billgrantia sp. LNSP4103-1]|uniref:hypothetical protein n=1 Tax=Billgrantia sp. LNSP4103-1 TaxID=3410266 RepID=UPI00403F164F